MTQPIRTKKCPDCARAFWYSCSHVKGRKDFTGCKCFHQISPIDDPDNCEKFVEKKKD
jgi:hypothetical protein